MLTLLSNFEGPVGVDQQNIWANEFGLGHPVLSDDDLQLSSTYWVDDIRPNAIYLEPGAQVRFDAIRPDQFREMFASELE